MISKQRYIVMHENHAHALFALCRIYKIHNPTMHQSHIPRRTNPITHNAPVLFPAMHHFETCVHISVPKWCIVGYLSNSPRDLWDRPFALFCGMFIWSVLPGLFFFRKKCISSGTPGGNRKIAIFSNFFRKKLEEMEDIGRTILFPLDVLNNILFEIINQRY